MERDPVGARPAERREPVADLLEARPEPVTEQVDVVALLLRRLQEALVGHQHGRREVVGHRHAAERAGGVAHEVRVARQPVEDVGQGEQAHLVRQLKVSAAAPEHLREQQLPPPRVEPAHRAAHRSDLLDADPHTLRPLEVLRQGLEQILPFKSRFAPQPLRALLQIREVVHLALDEIAHLLGGQTGDLDPLELLPFRQALREDFRGAPSRLVGMVEVEEGTGDELRMSHLVAHVGRGEPEAVEDRIAEDFEKVGHQPLVFSSGEDL